MTLNMGDPFMAEIDERFKTLDERLDSLIDLLANRSNSAGLKGFAFIIEDKWREQIKQAFKDAGYVQMAYNSTDMTVAGRPVAKILQTDDTHMTGQEWYDKFKQEFIAEVMEPDAHYTIDDITYLDDLAARDILNIAKKSAGIE